MRPITLLTFANDNSDHLELLKEESKNIYRALEPHHHKETIEIHRDKSVEPDDLFHIIDRAEDRLQILHYAGHANSTTWDLEGQSLNSKGIAQFIKDHPNLLLVFLNGCATRKQVDDFQDAGIPAVIATDCPVGDESAMRFATQFYQSFAKGYDLQKSFDKAAAVVEAFNKEGDTRSISIYRDRRGFVKEEDSQTVPWGLYVHKGKESILNWKLGEIWPPKEKKQIIIIADTIADKKHVDEFEKYLSVYGLPIWHYGKMRPGENIEDQIKMNMKVADFVLLFINGNYSSSDKCKRMEEIAFSQKNTQVIPILLDYFPWKFMSFHKDHGLDPLPKNQEPISAASWGNRANAINTIMMELQELIS